MIQVKNSSNLLESGMELQDSERSSKKLRVIIFPAVLMLMLIPFGGVMYYVLHSKDPGICYAQAELNTDTKESGIWKWSKMPTFCMKQTTDQKLMITQKGKFLIYGQLRRNNESQVPFAIQVKNRDNVLSQRKSEEDFLIFLGIYHLNEGDEISLNFNDSFEHIEKNSTQTYWGISRIPPYIP